MLLEKLKETRLALGLTQKDFGELLGISSNTIARYERGEIQPKHPKVLEMAVDFLRVQETPRIKNKLQLLKMSKEDFAAQVS